MGGRDKGLVEHGGRPLIDQVIERLAPQVDALLISANRNLDDYARRGFSVLSDSLPGFQGPLAGLAEGLRAARHHWLIAVPCDVPRLPENLVWHLAESLDDGEAAFARDDERAHPAIVLLSKACLPKLEGYLEGGGRSVKGFLATLHAAAAYFPDPAAFINVNRLTENK